MTKEADLAARDKEAKMGSDTYLVCWHQFHTGQVTQQERQALHHEFWHDGQVHILLHVTLRDGHEQHSHTSHDVHRK